MSIKSKLDIYMTPAHADAPRAHEDIPRPHADLTRMRDDLTRAHDDITRPHADQGAALQFGDVILEEAAPGVYRRRLALENPLFGARELNDYLPFELTGILELALLVAPQLIHPSELLFLDTETAGLSRGAGNFPFLTGLAYFQDDELCIEQLYLDDIAGEEEYLDYLNALIGKYPYLVSYNGKAFDMPLIRNRLILNRKKSVVPLVHFDLLHILRRLYVRGSLPGRKQKDLEAAMLGMERQNDLPGAEVPQIYFDYRKYGHDGGMERIFQHNLLDVQGLAFLLLEAIRVYRERDLTSPGVRSGLARILAKNKRVTEAIELLSDEAVQRKRLDLIFLAGLHRSRGQWDRAAELLEEVADEFDCAYSRLALAKILEHRLRERPGSLEKALRLTERLLVQLHERAPDGPAGARASDLDVGSAGKPAGKQEPVRTSRLFAAEELQRRRARIIRKMNR